MTAIVMFDGECNFCDASVQFIIARDPNAYFRFAALQSEVGVELKKKYRIPDQIDSFILIENNQVYKYSDGALEVCKHLKGLWKSLYLLKVVPRPIRNRVYRYIAKNRYKWFGKKEECMIPSPEVRDRFLL